MNRDVYDQSRKVILDNQQPGGGYLACPNMPDYNFSWFRDGAFIAYGLTIDGIRHSIMHPKVGIAAQWDSAGKFHDWAARMIIHRAEAIERSIERAQRGEPLLLEDTLNARYTADGVDGPNDWPEFQLDGPGLWIWSLAKYAEVARITPLPVNWEYAVHLASRYLAAVWRSPCYDCWEERCDDVHISTLAAIYTGLRAAQTLVADLDFSHNLQEIKDFVLSNGLTPTGELTKSVGLDMVDANLLLAALPDGMFNPDDPLIQRTVARIERDLLADGHGVHRHLDDTYYGGGPWVLLGLWLAWYYTTIGNHNRALELFHWAESHADAEGNLPEQVNDVMYAPDFYPKWVEWRGEIANPLLWTHAKYLLVYNALERIPVTG